MARLKVLQKSDAASQQKMINLWPAVIHYSIYILFYKPVALIQAAFALNCLA